MRLPSVMLNPDQSEPVELESGSELAGLLLNLHEVKTSSLDSSNSDTTSNVNDVEASLIAAPSFVSRSC